MAGCRDCEKYSWPKECTGKEKYSYSDIVWCRWQIPWLIINGWPPPTDSTGYTDLPIKRGFASEGYFVKPMTIIGELYYRLEGCKKDGDHLVEDVEAEVELRPESRDALNYCSGFNRKRMGYIAWKKQRKYRRQK